MTIAAVLALAVSGSPEQAFRAVACGPEAPCGFFLAGAARTDPVQRLIELDLPPDTPFSFEVLAGVRSLSPPAEPSFLGSSWLFSMSVTHDPRMLSIEELRPAGGQDLFPSLVLEPAEGGIGSGFIAATILYDGPPRYSQFTGEAAFVRARYSLKAHIGPERIGETLSTAIRFQDGLRGSGEPVPNWLLSAAPSFLDDLEVRITVREDRLFIRGDANHDRKVDVSDPVAILHGLFLGEPAILCRDAADLNDDGALHVTDAIYALNHLFRGGEAPLPPFPAAGADPTPDSLFCFDPSRERA